MREQPKKMAKKKADGKDGDSAELLASAKPGKKKQAAKKGLKKPAPKKKAKSTVAKRSPKAIAKVKLTRGKPDAAKVPIDPFEIAKQTMKGSVPAIVATMVKKAKQGSCTHAKTLLEMTGAKHMFDGEAEGNDLGEPWAKLVLERLDEAESSVGQQDRQTVESTAEHS